MYCVPWDNLKQTSAGAALLSTAEAKQHARVYQDQEDSLVDSYVKAATADVENMLGMALASSTWVAYLDCFPACREIVIPRTPLVSVTSITYVDANGATQTYASGNYHAIANQSPGRILLASSASWPSARPTWGDVRITMTLGYGNPAAVPEIFKQAVRLRLSSFIEQRDNFRETLDSAIAMIVRNHGNRKAA